MARRTSYIKAMLMGDPGIGKTVSLGSCAGDSRFGRTLMLDFEANVMSIESKLEPLEYDRFADPDFVPEAINKIYHLRVRSWNRLQNAIDRLYEQMESEAGLKWDTLLVDSIGEINYICLTKNTEANYVKTKKGDGRKPIIGDYGDTSAEMRKLIREFRDLDMHVIFSSHTYDDKDEQTGVIETVPKLTGQLKVDVPGMLNIVGYMRVPKNKDNDDRREIVFQPTGRIKCVKDQSEGGKLGKSMLFAYSDPVWPMIADRLEGKTSKEGEATVNELIA